MKLAILVLLFGSSLAKDFNVFENSFNLLHREPPPPKWSIASRASVRTKWIEQKLDHFDKNEKRTWLMRYMSNDEYFKPGGPIFIFVGGEWTISSGYLVGGHMHDMAKEHNGYLFYTEHRFYGFSIPTSDLRVENLKTLTTQQALADLAHFIRKIKAKISGLGNSKVILVGGSYSGSMVTWFKRTYPDLIVGGWASSAPLFAKVNFFEYKEVAGQSIKLVGGQQCYDRIQNGIAELENMFNTKRGAEVKAMLKICNNFDETNDLDVWTLFSSISDIFAGIVQTHRDGDIQRVCANILKAEDDVTGIATFVLRYFGIGACADVSYKAFITQLSDTKFSNDMMRQWIYQTCDAYGWYSSSESRAQPFGSQFPVAHYIAQCNDVYGDQFTNYTIHKKVDDTNKEFGGLSPNVQNIHITHGQLDPWNAMGITDAEQATVIPLHSHCQDFASISPSDTPEMRAAKEKIAKLVREWLK